MTRRVVWIAIVLTVGALSLSGCCCTWPPREQALRIARDLGVGPVESKTLVVEQENAERVRATVKFGGGELDVSGGGESLLRGEFVYNVEELEPEVTYDVQDGQGELLVKHGSDPIRLDQLALPDRGELRNEWTLAFSEDVPLDLQLDVGASYGKIELGGLMLENLDLTMGAADLQLGFDRPNSERLRSFHIYSGAAKLELSELGNANLERLTFDGGLGTYHFDFGGDWQQSADVRILAGASQVTLRLPTEVGVRVCPGDMHREHMDGLQELDGCFVNSLYGKADITLDIDLDLGLGKVEIRQEY
jgi:hypothetical protein